MSKQYTEIRRWLPLFANIVERERWHGDLPPVWPKAKTAAETDDLALANIKRLLRFRHDFAEAEALAERLNSCCAGKRCMSGACVRCGRAFQRWSADQIVEIASYPTMPPNETIAISIVPPETSAFQGCLKAYRLKHMMEKVCAGIEETGQIYWGVFGLDISFNDLKQRGGDEIWQGQVYGLVETSNRRKLRNRFKKLFPATDRVPRPVRTKRYDGSARGASYALKFQFVRRVSYWDETGRWNTRKVRLKPPEHVELLLALDKLELHRRLEVVGLHAALDGDKTVLTWDL